MDYVASIAAAVTTALFLVVAVERVTAAVLAPIKARYPAADFWWAIYPSWALGSLLVFAAGLNLLADIAPGLPPLVGQIVTAVIAGGGPNLLHDLFDQLKLPATPTVTLTTSAPPDPTEPVDVAALRLRR